MRTSATKVEFGIRYVAFPTQVFELVLSISIGEDERDR
jgi:hypothetical protein